MRLPNHFLEEYPEAADVPVKGSASGLLFVNEEKVGQATIHVGMSGSFIEWGGRFLTPQSLQHIPFDYVTSLHFVDVSRKRVAVQINTQSQKLQFHMKRPDQTQVVLFNDLMEHMEVTRHLVGARSA